LNRGRYFVRGFTLIELLVVIAIIAMLLSILMPALQTAKSMAKGVVCMTNVRRLSLGMLCYFNENKDYFPPDRYRENGQFIHVGPYRRFRPRWIWFLDQDVGPVIDPYKFQTEEEFNMALEMDNDYFICPGLADRKFARNIRNGAYGLNYQYLSNTRPGPQGQRWSNFPNKSTNIRRPSETILLGDSRGADIPHGEHAYCMDPPKMAYSKGARHFSPKSKSVGPLKYSPADARHLGKACMSFVDCHAERLKYEEMGYVVDPETERPVEKSLMQVGGPGDNRYWSGACKDEPDIP